MKAVFLILGLAMVSFAAQADGLSRFGFGGSRPQVTCTSTDNGWEEHWGGHRDCASCKAAHGTCTETCTSEETFCTAEGTLYNGYDRTQSRVETFRGRGNDRWDAESDAVNECRRYGGENCHSVNCNTDTQIVSQRGC